MDHAAKCQPRVPVRPAARTVPPSRAPRRARQLVHASMPKLARTIAVTPLYVITWGAIQKESRPICRCHWMSHCVPQPAHTWAAISVQKPPRATATSDGDPAATRAPSVSA